MADLHSFIQFLVSDMEASQSTAFCEDLLDKAKSRISKGQGQIAFLEVGSLNGKSFTVSKEMSCLDMASACRQALDFYRDEAGSSNVTFLSFCGLR